MGRVTSLSLFFVSLASCVGADNPAEETDLAQQAKVIGTNDLVRVSADGTSLPMRYRPLIDAIGILMRNGFPACTATHIGNGLVLTAGHCFRAPSYRVNNIPCETFGVRWGVRGPHSYLNSQCSVLLAAEYNAERDYAIFRVLDETPRAKISVDFSRRPPVGTKLTMFGHPKGRPLEWSKTCGLHAGVIEAGAGDDEFWHECDTENGSSGAAMLDDATLRIIGVNTGSRRDPSPFNYGTYLANTPIAELIGTPTL